jgi:hypothetical protein
VDKEFFLKNLDSMSSHYWRDINATPGKYWGHYAKLIYKQTKLSGDILQPSCFYAAGFGGAPYNGFLPDIEISNFERLFERLLDTLQHIMIKVAYDKSILDPIFRCLFLHKRSCYYRRISSVVYCMLVRWGYEFYREQIEHYDITSPDIYGVDCVEIGSRKLSFTTIFELGFFLALKKSVLPATNTILEIGSGVGEVARILLTTKTCKKYIIIDIPPALAFSQRLISETFGDEKMSFWRKDRKVVDLGDKNICYFLTPDQIDQAPNFDLGINRSSFGEMSPGIVKGYIEVLKKKNFNDFISFNQRINKSNNSEIIGEKQYTDYFFPDYECTRKAFYDFRHPFRDLEEDRPEKQGYQWLHFQKVGLKARNL